MRALVVEHDPYTDPALVAEALASRGYDVVRRLVVPPEHFASPGVEHAFPDPAGFDVVVPMGAPWSVDDPAIGPWIGPELAMLRAAHEAGVPVLGICFGGQALAAALGGGVRRAPRWELSWCEVDTVDPALVPRGPWFQFHQDAMVVPAGATVVATSPVCPQAWTLGRTMAVQFHPEVTPGALDTWIAQGGDRPFLENGLDLEAVRRATSQAEAPARRRAHALVGAFLDRVAARPAGALRVDLPRG